MGKDPNPAEPRPGHRAVRREVRLPGAEELGKPGIGYRPGTDQCCAAHPLRIGDRDLLGDRAAHRCANDVRPLDPERVHQPDRVIGALPHVIVTCARPGLAHIAVVEGDDAELAGEGGDLLIPARPVSPESVDHHHRVAGAGLVPGNRQIADGRLRHGILLLPGGASRSGDAAPIDGHRREDLAALD